MRNSLKKGEPSILNKKIDGVILTIAALILFLFFSLEFVAWVRMIEYGRQLSLQTFKSTGSIGFRQLPKSGGVLTTLQVDTGGTLEFSCAQTGLRENASCFGFEGWMNGKKVTINWFESPVNIFTGTTRHPLLVHFVESGKEVKLADSPFDSLRKSTWRKGRSLLITLGCYFALFFLVKKLLTLKSKATL